MSKLIQVKITIGKKVDGTLVRKSFYGKSKREARAKAQEYLIHNTYSPINKNIYFSEWAERWLEVYKAGNVADITYENTYQNPVCNHIIPYFKNIRLIDIKEIDIQTFYNSTSHYSQSVLNKLKVSINAIFESAIKNQLIQVNPAKGVPTKSKALKKEKYTYTKKQTEVIIDFAKAHPDGVIVIALLKTGMRRSEVFALKWNDINFSTDVITVRNSIAESKYGMKIGPPKTLSSIADIPLDPELKALLEVIPRSISGFVFPNSMNKMMSPHNWANRNYRRFTADLKNKYPDLPTLSMHELRHTFGSLIYESTRDIYITSKLMRHANIDITARIYTHETIEDKRQAMKKAFNTN